MMKENSINNYCHVVGGTDVGCKRQANEDSMGTLETINGLVAVVCDGMGGHVGGATASRIAVESILDFLNSKFYEDPRLAIGEAIDAANRAILHQASVQPGLRGMGSTCVLLLVRNGKVYIGHVGDSRIYLVRNRRIKQLTKDHSYVQMLVDMKQLSPEQAEHHPRKNEITNALGISDMKSATVMSDAILPEAGDCFLLCSDGLSGMVPDKEIEKVISRQTEMRAQERADYLIRKAKENGGLDNITVQLVEFSITPSAIPVKKKKWPLIALLAVIGGILIGGGIYAYLRWVPEIIPRKKEVKVLEQVGFIPQNGFLELKYDAKSTSIFINGKEMWSSPETFSRDSLKCNNTVSVLGENSLLQFKQEFTSDTLYFSLANNKMIYDFKVPVKILVKEDEKVKEEQKTGSGNEKVQGGKEVKKEKQVNQNKTKETENKSAITSSLAVMVVDSMVYPPKPADFNYQNGEKFLTFKEGSSPCCTILKIEYAINGIGSFTVDSVRYDRRYISQAKSNGEYNFFYTDQVPPQNMKIIFIGRKKENVNDTPALFHIIINLHKK